MGRGRRRGWRGLGGIDNLIVVNAVWFATETPATHAVDGDVVPRLSRPDSRVCQGLYPQQGLYLLSHQSRSVSLVLYRTSFRDIRRCLPPDIPCHEFKVFRYIEKIQLESMLSSGQLEPMLSSGYYYVTRHGSNSVKFVNECAPPRKRQRPTPHPQTLGTDVPSPRSCVRICAYGLGICICTPLTAKLPSFSGSRDMWRPIKERRRSMCSLGFVCPRRCTSTKREAPG